MKENLSRSNKKQISNRCQYVGCRRILKGKLRNSTTLRGVKICGSCVQYERRKGKLVPRSERVRGRVKKEPKSIMKKKQVVNYAVDDSDHENVTPRKKNRTSLLSTSRTKRGGKRKIFGAEDVPNGKLICEYEGCGLLSKHKLYENDDYGLICNACYQYYKAHGILKSRAERKKGGRKRKLKKEETNAFGGNSNKKRMTTKSGTPSRPVTRGAGASK